MAIARPSRVSPVVVAIALGLLAPLPLFAATWLLATTPKPAAQTEASPPSAAREPVVTQAPATSKSWPLSQAERPSPPIPTESPEDSPRRFMSVATSTSIREPVALNVPAAAPPTSAPPSVVPVVATSAPPSNPPTPPRVACGATTCAPGDVCCNSTCGICTSPGQTCTRQNCGAGASATSAPCGHNTCNVGEVCCNPSCGICAAPGATCSQARCDDGPTLPFSQTCGMNTCNVGTVCCDASCGLCAPVAECAHLHC
jgi:hypothetical protein